MASTTDPLSQFGTKQTPQTQAVPGRSDQVVNNAGGYVFQVNPLTQLRRFLTIGTAGGTYYVGQSKLTQENGQLIITMIQEGPESHRIIVDEIVRVSIAGRAPKPNQALFALAIACQMGETEGKQYARSKINQVVRTGTHLFTFIGYLEQFGGIGRGLRTALGKWYTEKDADDLSLQLIKYRQRNGWTHRDVLRKAHPKEERPAMRAALDWTVGKKTESQDNLPDFIRFFQQVNEPGVDVAEFLKQAYLPWEALPDSAMNDTKVWGVMLDNGMPITALVRQLPRLTSIGVISPMGGRTADVVSQLTNEHKVRKSRIHPIQVLTALKTYKQGHGEKGKLTWVPVPAIIDALDDMFYMSFANVVPTGKRILSAIDLSASMTWAQNVPPNQPLNCRELAAAMNMITVRTETNHLTMGFTTGGGYSSRWGAHAPGMVTLPISARQRLDDVVRTIGSYPAGGTDCSLPITYALTEGIEVDAFIIYTDNETWAGDIQPFQALQQYRKTTGIDAKFIVQAMTPTKFSIADPLDTGMLDVSGFDSATPAFISDFIRGDV